MSAREFLHGENGVATVTFALMVPAFLLFCVLAVDVGNWYVHKRHLQKQADAAALAGATAYRFPNCDDDAIGTTALQYSGVGASGIAYNDQFPTIESSRLHAVLNGSNFHGQSVPADVDYGSDSTFCSAGIVDVKMTENDLPWFFGTGIVEHINAQARVQLFDADRYDGLLPLGVQETTPKTVRAFIVNESTGAVVKDVPLELDGNTTGGLKRFDNEAAPVSFTPPAGATNLGVRVALSGGSSTVCGAPLVACYDSGAATGLSYVRVSSATAVPGTNKQPVARAVSWSPVSCANGSFSSAEAACTADLEATIVWDSAVTAGNIATGTGLTADVAGTPYPMTYSAADGTWTATVTLPAGTIGTSGVDLKWTQSVGKMPGPGNKEQDCAKKNAPCEGTIAGVQRTFWNDPLDQSSRGGPIAALDLRDGIAGPLVSDLCSTCSAQLVVNVAIKGALDLDGATDPPRSLRVAGSGSQNQSVDCDPGKDFSDELAYGCEVEYVENTGTACTTPTSPLSCVPVETGTSANKPAKGLNTRILCEPVPGNCGGSAGNWNGKPSFCPAAGELGHNNWPDYPDGDPRVAPVLVVPFGSFQGSGNAKVPIIDVAAFYVTGYAGSGGGFDNPCAAQGDDFADGTENDNGVISGHFVKFVDSNTGGASEEPCDLTNDLGQCVAVLVK